MSFFFSCWVDVFLFVALVIPMILSMKCMKYNYGINTRPGRQGCMKSCSMLVPEFVNSISAFVAEALLKPCSGPPNWKGALQEGLVIHRYQLTLPLFLLLLYCIYFQPAGYMFVPGWKLLSLAIAVSIMILFLLTWHFWFALTQRDPIGLPATSCVPCGVLLGLVALGTVTMVLDNTLYEATSYAPAKRDLTTWIALGCAFIGSLSTACCVFESKQGLLVASVGVALMIHSVCWLAGLLLCLGTITMSIDWHNNWHWWEIAAIAVILYTILVFANQLHMAVCIVAVGWQRVPTFARLPDLGLEIADAQERCGHMRPEEQLLGKTSANVQSVSTAPTDEENSAAESHHGGVLDQPYGEEEEDYVFLTPS